MAALTRSRGTWILILLLATGLFVFREKRSLGGPATPPGVCPNCNTATTTTISTTVVASTFPGNIINIPDNLLMTSTGHIVCNDPASPTADSACNITLNVGGNMTMQAGSSIDANNTVDGGHGGTIFITVCGDLTMDGPSGADAGALITSQHLSNGTDDGGKITVVVGCVTLDTSDPAIGICGNPTGDILISAGATITSNSNSHRAGDIALYAGRNITVKGTVSAEGTGGTGHGGAITIDACCELFVDDTGVVTSRGLDPGADRVHLEGCVVTILGLVQSTAPGHTDPSPLCTPPIRPGKPPESTGCVEIWAGTTLTIDSTGTHKGEINADIGFSGGTSGRGWIDILANGNILLNDGAGNDGPSPNLAPGDLDSPYLVHANMNVLTNSFGGVILVQSRLGKVDTFGNALQANATPSGGKGGLITVEAGGLSPVPGGDVNFHDASIQAIGSNTNNCPSDKEGGHIFARSSNGQVLGVPNGELNADGGNAPANDTCDHLGDVTLQDCGPPPDPAFAYGGTVIPAPPIILADTCGVPVVFPAFAPGSHEVYPADTCATACQPVTPTPTPTVTSTPTPTTTPTPFCNKLPVQTVLAGRVPDVIVRTDLGGSIQAAVAGATDTNGDGYIIVGVVSNGTGALGGSTTQNVVIDQVYPKPFLLIGCSVTMINPRANAGNPTGWIKPGAGVLNPPGGNIFAMDLHGTGSTGVNGAGWKVEGNGRELRNTGASGNTTGIWFVGGNNIMHNGAASSNSGVGLKIEGNGNYVTDTDVFSNTSHGVQVIGNNNQLLKIDAGDIGKGNGGDGVNVNGTGNLIQECDAYANSGNGISATGGANTLNKNNGGGKGKGNGQKGIAVGGSGPLTQNTARGNTGFGFDLTSGGHTLKNNVSGGTGSGEPNGGCQYNVAGSNTNSGGNTSNGVTVTGNPFPTGCKN
jgi:hypothetical protein